MMQDKPETSRPEWIVILAMTLVAAAIRLAGFGRLGLDHFDEGIYASAGTWSLTAGGLASIDPGLIPYAPPLYPILVGLSYGLFAPTDRAVIAVSIVAGIATIPVAGWLGRRTFGPGAGAAAAGFAAGSMSHITFSRMALTDATFLLAWLVSIGAGCRFLERPGAWRAVALGLAVGLAQLTKYNGWLAGAIVAATALLGPVVSLGDRTRARLARTFWWGALAAVVAAVVEWPWFRFVEGHGGYASLLRHQRGYLDGPGSWPANWLLQLRQLAALGVGCGPILAMLALVGLAALQRRRLRGPVASFAGLGVVCLLLFRASTTWWIGLALLAFFLPNGSPGVRMVGIWWIVLSILTPMYHPYARLWLPLEAAGWLVGGAIVASAFRSVQSTHLDMWRTNRRKVIATGLALVAGWAVPGLIPPRTRALPGGLVEPRDSLRAATARIVTHIPSDVRSVSVLGRPAMLFYTMPILGWRGIVGGRMPDSAALLAPGDAGWAIVDSVLLRQEGAPGTVLGRLVDRWEIVAEEPTTLSNATLLDVDPAGATGDLSARSEPLLLLRPKPSP